MALASSSCDVEQLIDRYRSVRAYSETIASHLNPEDCVIQSMPDASPIRWHLAHTTWFFETFILRRYTDFEPENQAFEFLFNSYYNTVGQQFPRARRGMLSRPTVSEVIEYRQSIDQAILDWLESDFRIAHEQHRDSETPAPHDVFEIGLQHEQQHQELMLTDVKHLLSCNPISPRMFSWPLPTTGSKPESDWVEIDEGVYEVGHEPSDCFAYDNESPRHRVFLEPFQICSRLTTNGDFLEFLRDGGYRRPEHWLSSGWATVQSERWTSPIYWHEVGGRWHEFTLAGLAPLDLNAPLTHISYFEADAYARWEGARLPTEAEWEVAADSATPSSTGAEDFFSQCLSVQPYSNDSSENSQLHDLFGSVWQWTASQYVAYPGYQPPPGALGEYNGKFMCNQFVLRGSSCATPRNHARLTYRNFFPPDARWQFAGLRLARTS